MQAQQAQAQPAQPAQVAAPAADDTIVQLQKLAELQKAGVITEEEFAAKKKQLLGI
jgi:membrane protease subunit (stomatin/prohibitin family)